MQDTLSSLFIDRITEIRDARAQGFQIEGFIELSAEVGPLKKGSHAGLVSACGQKIRLYDGGLVALSSQGTIHQKPSQFKLELPYGAKIRKWEHNQPKGGFKILRTGVWKGNGRYWAVGFGVIPAHWEVEHNLH